MQEEDGLVSSINSLKHIYNMTPTPYSIGGTVSQTFVEAKMGTERAGPGGYGASAMRHAVRHLIRKKVTDI